MNLLLVSDKAKSILNNLDHNREAYETARNILADHAKRVMNYANAIVVPQYGTFEGQQFVNSFWLEEVFEDFTTLSNYISDTWPLSAKP